MEEEELRLLLWRTARACSRHYRGAIADIGLTSRQATALRIIVQHPGINLTSLAAELIADQSTASAVVDRLMSEGLVRRDIDRRDRRKAAFHATEEALSLSAKLLDAGHETEDTLVTAIGREKSVTLRQLLVTLCDGLDNPGLPVEEQERTL